MIVVVASLAVVGISSVTLALAMARAAARADSEMEMDTLPAAGAPLQAPGYAARG
jgi:hypothetical protein